jgi:hypothetical protein
MKTKTKETNMRITQSLVNAGQRLRQRQRGTFDVMDIHPVVQNHLYLQAA